MNHADYCSQFLSDKSAVLDIGSGRGDFLCEMSRRGFLAVGVENNQCNVDLSLKKAREYGTAINVIKAKAEQLPFPDSSFDFINCSEVTEHVEDPELVVREIYRVLRPNGQGYISFTNRFGIYDCHFHLLFINFLPRKFAEMMLCWFKKNKSDSDSGRQTLLSMYYFTYNQAAALLKQAGFIFNDTRVERIRKQFGRLASIFVFFYHVFIRPFYFSTFHFVVKKS